MGEKDSRQIAHLLFLELGVLWDEESEALVDAALLEELVELVLDTHIQSIELTSHQNCRRENTQSEST